MLPEIWQSVALLECSHTLHACSSGKNSSKMTMIMGHWWNGTDRIKQKFSEKHSNTLHNDTLSTTNLTWTGMGSNLDLRSERSVTNRLSHDAASQ
jgi:hypothetical protein